MDQKSFFPKIRLRKAESSTGCGEKLLHMSNGTTIFPELRIRPQNSDPTTNEYYRDSADNAHKQPNSTCTAWKSLIETLIGFSRLYFRDLWSIIWLPKSHEVITIQIT